jgi:hypothetical protein
MGVKKTELKMYSLFHLKNSVTIAEQKKLHLAGLRRSSSNIIE